MKRLRYTLVLLLTSLTLPAAAQDAATIQPVTDIADEIRHDLAADSLETDSAWLDMPALPLVDLAAPGFDGMSPWYYGSYGPSWRLHEGFNAQLGMSLSVGFGKNAPSGVGFGQTAAFAYALPLSERFAAAVGVYANNMDWGGLRQTDGGVAAALQWRVSDAVSLYAYGAKSFLPANRTVAAFVPFPAYLNTVRDRVGAMAEFKVGKNAMIQVSVEKQSY